MTRKYKLHLLFLLTLPLLFQACSDDDELSREDLLNGTWLIQSAALSDYTVTINGQELSREEILASPFLSSVAQDVEEELEDFLDELFPTGTTITFSDDNTYLLANPNTSENMTNTWTLSTDEQEVAVQLGDDSVLDDSLDELVFNISELSETSLDLLLNVGEDDLDLDLDTDDDLGFSIDDYNIEYTFSFSKQ